MDILLGLTSQNWRQLLRDNHYAVEPKHWKRLTAITMASLATSRQKRAEDEKFGAAIAATKVAAPIFIIGHWRSGTTLLHRLLTLNDQFYFASNFHVANPHTFLLREQGLEQWLQQTGRQTRPMDNVEFDPLSPAEHETAMMTLSLRSMMLSWVFPQRQEYYDRFLTFADASADDIAAWKQSMRFFLQKLTYCSGKQIMLKSPPDTGRIRLLLETFPDARFVNIHRNPYDVFRSTQNLYTRAVATSHLQRRSNPTYDEDILRRYRELYDAFFAEKALIPAGRFVEIRFADLERDFVGQVSRVYAELGLPGAASALAQVEAYAREQANYQKTQHQPLPAPLRAQIAALWQPSFEAWGYPA